MRYWARRMHPAQAKPTLRSARARVALRKAQGTNSDRLATPQAGVSSVSDAGIAFIVGFEGFSAKPYWDSIGSVWSRQDADCIGQPGPLQCGLLRRSVVRDPRCARIFQRCFSVSVELSDGDLP